MPSKRYEIRALSFGEILDGGFRIYRDHFGVFLGTSFILGIPGLLGFMATNWLSTGSPFVAPVAPEGAPPEVLTRTVFSSLLGLPVFMGFYVLQYAALTQAVASAYLGEEVTIGTILRRTLARLGTIFVSTFTSITLGFLAMIPLVIPGILLLLRWSFAVDVIMIEGSAGMVSLKRSRKLTYGRRWRLLGLFLLVYAVQFGLYWGIGAQLPASLKSLPAIPFFIEQLPAFFIAPLMPAVTALAYFDARVRSEAFDLEVMASETFQGAAAGGAVPAAAGPAGAGGA